MTSQKYSANNNAMFDFKRTLKNLIPPAIVSLFAAALNFILYPYATFANYIDSTSTAAENLKSIRANVAVALTGTQGYTLFSSRSAQPIGIGIVALIVGVLFAFFSFAFLMKKRSVNVYLSIGLDRKTLFKNRVLASMLLMAATSLLPILIDVFMNIHYIGHASYVIGLGVALFLEYFTFMLAGFSIMAISMTLCNTIVESLFFGAGALWFPTLAVFGLTSFCYTFLRGFARMLDIGVSHGKSILNYTTIVNPVFFSKAVGNYSVTTNVFGFVCRGTKPSENEYNNYFSAFTNFGYKQMPFNYIIPIIVWLVFSAAFIFIARQILLRRKAENASMHGKEPFVNHFFCAELALLLSASTALACKENGAEDMHQIPDLLIFLIAALVFAITFFIFISISMRKIKHGKKELVTVLSSIGILCVVTLVLVTGGFGYTNRVPNLENVKYAIITSNEINATGGEFNGYFNEVESADIFKNNYDNCLGVFDGKEDLEKFVSVHKNVAKKPHKGITRDITIKYMMKNNSVFERTYDMVDDETIFNVLSLTDTDSYKNELSFLLSPERKDEKKSHADEVLGKSLYGDTLYPYEIKSAETIKFVLHKSPAYLINSDGNLSEKKRNKNKIKNTDELRAAILKDLLEKDYKERYASSEKPIGAVMFYAEEPSEDNNVYGYEIDPETGEEIEMQIEEIAGGTTVRYYLYPSMKNTITYLKSTGEYKLLTEDHAVEEYEINKVIIVKTSDFIRNMEFGFYENTSRLVLTSFRNYDLNDAYFSDGIYKKALEKGKTIKEADQIKELEDASRIAGFAFDDDYIALFGGKNYNYTRIIKAADVPEFAK